MGVRFPSAAAAAAAASITRIPVVLALLLLKPCTICSMHQLPISGLPALRSPTCRCGLVLVDVEIPLVALADGVHSRSFSGARLLCLICELC